jgi:tRNA threonylcarbamoyladenosine modification (KEOPS) complex  Pcc1 subunit
LKALAKIELKFKDYKTAKALFSALKPETLKPPSKRSKTSITLKKNFLTINFQAKDSTALRAAVNSYLRYAAAWLNIIETIIKS